MVDFKYIIKIEGGFKKWYIPNGYADGRKTNLSEILNGYEEKGIEEFSDVIKFLYHQYAQLKIRHEFDMEEALQLYEGESG